MVRMSSALESNPHLRWARQKSFLPIQGPFNFSVEPARSLSLIYKSMQLQVINSKMKKSGLISTVIGCIVRLVDKDENETKKTSVSVALLHEDPNKVLSFGSCVLDICF